MRVLHLGKFFPPHPGGIERFCAELVAAQRAAGIEARVLAHASPRRAPTAHPHVDFVRCHGQLLFVPISPGWPRALARVIALHRPQLLHVHVPNPSAFWLLAIPAARRLPWLLHWHADVPHDTVHRGLRLAYPPYRALERRLLARSQRVIATSTRYLEASRPLQAVRERVRVVPLGIAEEEAGSTPPDATAGSPTLAWPAPGLRLLAVGRLSFYKGFDVLLDALADAPEASLLIIGDGERRAALQRRIEALGLRDRVRLLGQVDDATLAAAYRGCEAFCLPSLDRSEAFGVVLLEAMRAGRAVLVSDIPGSGVGEVVDDGVSGHLLPVGQAARWAESIRALAAAPGTLLAMGQAGRRRWHARFRIAPVADALTPIYRELLGADAAAS